MEICVIHGSNRKGGNTEKTIQIIKKHLSALENITYSDIYLPKDLPCFCEGCFACLATGEYAGQNCPHKQYTHPILEKLLRCDGLLVASPVYALAETGQLKVLFDHFACTYISHRPNAQMFSKVALVVSTAAAMGTGRTVSTISRNLLFWGVSRIIKCKINLWEKDWNAVSPKNRRRIEKALRRSAKKFYKLINSRNSAGYSIESRVIRNLFKQMICTYPDTQPDKIYWKSKGWI